MTYRNHSSCKYIFVSYTFKMNPIFELLNAKKINAKKYKNIKYKKIIK